MMSTMPTVRKPVPVTVFTGFLGSGKTTILSRLVRDAAFADTAVILNEFGEVGLDHLLVETSDETVIDLSCGCICCTIRGDLVETLTDLRIRREQGRIRPFARVVLETTGLADPAPIVHTLMQEPSVFDHYRLAGVVTVVDSLTAMQTLDRQPEAAKQVALADTLAITKTDMAARAADRQSLDMRLRQINPLARQEICVRGDIDPGLVLSADSGSPPRALAITPVPVGSGESASGELLARNAVHGNHDDGISTFVVSRDEPVSHGVLGMFLQMLADQKGEDLLRLKGLVAVADDPSRPVVVHGVQHVVHPWQRLDRWPENAVPATSLVFIVRGISRDWVEALLDRVAASAYAALM